MLPILAQPRRAKSVRFFRRSLRTPGFFAAKSRARKLKFVEAIQSDLGFRLRHAQKFLFRIIGNCVSLRRPASSKRGVRVVTNVEAGCGGRDRGSRRLTRARTAKPCGPGAPKQALRSRGYLSRTTVATKRWSPGRARNTPLKPLRREGRVFSAEPVVLPRAFCCTRTMGASRYPVFPAPSLDQRGRLPHSSGAIGAARTRGFADQGL